MAEVVARMVSLKRVIFSCQPELVLVLSGVALQSNPVGTGESRQATTLTIQSIITQTDASGQATRLAAPVRDRIYFPPLALQIAFELHFVDCATDV